MGLISKKTEISKKDIKVYKVMLKHDGKYYVCPPSYCAISILSNGRLKPEEYKLGVVNFPDRLLENNNDTKEKGTVGAGYFHTFEKLSDAMVFRDNVENNIIKHSPENDPKHCYYNIPIGSEIVILEATIPKGSEYHYGVYNRTDTYSYASDRIIYNKELKGVWKVKRFSFLDKLAGRKVLYHGTSDEGAEGIRKNGLRYDYYKHSSNNTLGKLDKLANGTLKNKEMFGRLMDLDPEHYKDLVYMTSDKNSAEFMSDVNKRKGRGGQVLEISLPYNEHRNLKTVSNPEYQQAAHIHDSDQMSRHLFDKPLRELSKKEQEKVRSFVRAKNGDWIIKGKNIDPKFIKGSDKYEPVTLKEIIDYQKSRFKK